MLLENPHRVLRMMSSSSGGSSRGAPKGEENISRKPLAAPKLKNIPPVRQRGIFVCL